MMQNEKPVTTVTMPTKAQHAYFSDEEGYLRQLAAIVEYAEDAIISQSLEGMIQSWNRGAELLFGYTASEAIGYSITMIMPTENTGEEKQILEKIQVNQPFHPYDTVRVRKGGEKLYVSLAVSPLRSQQGGITGISLILRDITSQKRVEAELLHANKELAFQNKEKEMRAAELVIANKELAFQNVEKEKRAAELIIANRDIEISEQQLREVNKELESFSYSVSHDLRAPLRAVQGYAKMLKGNCVAQLDAEANRLLNNIVMNARKMGQLIDDLLAFSRIGRKELVLMNIAMETLVNDLCSELKNELSDRTIEFHIDGLLPARADNVTIKQVWLNLLSNAIKYSGLKDIAVIEIGSEMKGDEIIYHIKDNGVGFDMRYAHKLFGVFQRLHSDEEFEGTGVGLALVHRIITKHGGSVWADAKENEGATFFFTLPKS